MIILIIIFCIILLIDIPKLMKQNKRKKTIFIYIFLLTVGFVINILKQLDKLPISPTTIIEKIVKIVFIGE